ncbi:hypothetical protein PHLGIDRAFT_127378 [Phlebiopsis gigantea 11061_1 CR5-6]|uniref:RING-type domain-containing protein n=1 Tax=Phlebiopsis gigantea (strain 11061_1 CR5-6) TaxID=745531 RepID=A0A0C3SBE0_PHLG1|nr:hypothetical protein PHLGIDRAFT_127378 [Phlebiopsis gigantea 11061_1 CR5-6]
MECPICWDSLVSASTPTVSIPCGHLFHEKCLHPYMVQRAETGLPDCPTCREPIKLITGQQLARIPRELHELCHTAVRRVYVGSRETEADATAKELDYLYARVAQLQDGVQHAREKEESAEGRIAAIMGLWKTEQVRVAELQRRLQQAVLAQQTTQGLKPELRPSAPRRVADGPDQWRQLEDQMLMQAAAQLSTSWGPPPPAPPPPAQRPWDYHGQLAPPQTAGAETHAALHASPAASVAVVTHPYQPVLPSGGSPSGSAPPPPPPPQMQMMHAVPHPYASPSPAAPPEMLAAPYGAAAPPAHAQASGSGASSRTRHLAGFARERALENARLQQQQRWAQNQRVLVAYRQQHDAAMARVRQHPPQQHSYPQAAPPGQPWPST